jgi:hypothetical protein
MLRNAIGIVAAAVLVMGGEPVWAEVFQFAFTGVVTFEQVLENGQLNFQGPHTGMQVSGSFVFDPSLAPSSVITVHNISHDAGTSNANFVTGKLKFQNNDTFTPTLHQAGDSSLDSTGVQDEDSGDTDTVRFRDGGSRSSDDHRVTLEQAYLEIFVSESDPAIHDLVQAAAYGQTPNQARVAQFGTVKYFHLTVVPDGSSGFTSTEDTYGEFNLTSLTMVPEPSGYITLLGGLTLLAFYLRRRIA